MNNGAVAGIFIFLLVSGIIALAVLMIIAWWKILEKAGEPGWKVFIPVYGTYCMYKVADSTGLFWVEIVMAGIINIISTIVNASALSSRYGYYSYSSQAPVITVILVIFLIVTAILYIIFNVRLAKCFGQSGGFAAGLIFLNPIFTMILGFGSARYLGGSYQSTGKGIMATGTWKCVSCGEENPDSRATCSRCGAMK